MVSVGSPCTPRTPPATADRARGSSKARRRSGARSCGLACSQHHGGAALARRPPSQELEGREKQRARSPYAAGLARGRSPQRAPGPAAMPRARAATGAHTHRRKSPWCRRVNAEARPATAPPPRRRAPPRLVRLLHSSTSPHSPLLGLAAAVARRATASSSARRRPSARSGADAGAPGRRPLARTARGSSRPTAAAEARPTSRLWSASTDRSRRRSRWPGARSSRWRAAGVEAAVRPARRAHVAGVSARARAGNALTSLTAGPRSPPSAARPSGGRPPSTMISPVGSRVAGSSVRHAHAVERHRALQQPARRETGTRARRRRGGRPRQFALAQWLRRQACSPLLLHRRRTGPVRPRLRRTSNRPGATWAPRARPRRGEQARRSAVVARPSASRARRRSGRSRASRRERARTARRTAPADPRAAER